MNPKIAALRSLVETRLARLRGLTVEDRVAICGALDSLTAADVGGLGTAPPAPRDGVGGWREVELFAGDHTRASLFFVSAGTALPLHDHPDMTVFLRTIAGRFGIRSFDWEPAAGPGLAREIAAIETTPCDPACVLLPNHGNLHAIAALEPSAESIFLDLFAPYYDETERPCTCFREGETVEWRGERLVRLEAAPELDPDHT